MVNEKPRQLTMQKTRSDQPRSAVRNFDASALQPDLRILWNTSIFLNAYHSIFSMASSRDWIGRSVRSFHSIFFRRFGVLPLQHESLSE